KDFSQALVVADVVTDEVRDAHGSYTTVAGRKLTLKLAPCPIRTRGAWYTSWMPRARSPMRAVSSPAFRTSASDNSDRTVSSLASCVQIGHAKHGHSPFPPSVKPVVRSPERVGCVGNSGRASIASQFAPQTDRAPSLLGSPQRKAYSAASLGSQRIESFSSLRHSPNRASKMWCSVTFCAKPSIVARKCWWPDPVMKQKSEHHIFDAL